jgi:hypothetical protein
MSKEGKPNGLKRAFMMRPPQGIKGEDYLTIGGSGYPQADPIRS